MKKRIISVAVILVMLLSFAFSASAGSDDLLVDNADILSATEQKEFIEKFETFTEKYKVEIVFVTVPALDVTDEVFIDDFCEDGEYGYGDTEECVVLLYCESDMDGDSAVCMKAYGDTQYEITDEIIEQILLNMREDLLSKDFSAALDKYIEEVTEYVKPGVSIIWLFVLILVGIVVTLLILNGIASANNSVHQAVDARVYVREGSLAITGRDDIFKRSYVNKEPKATENKSGGSSASRPNSTGRGSGGSMKL